MKFFETFFFFKHFLTMSVTPFAFFVKNITPAWRAAWQKDKMMTIACCVWFEMTPYMVQKLRACNDVEESILILASLEVKFQGKYYEF